MSNPKAIAPLILHMRYFTESLCLHIGERCEDRGRVYEASCANQCPRSCADLWEHVQCLQGVCHPGTITTFHYSNSDKFISKFYVFHLLIISVTMVSQC